MTGLYTDVSGMQRAVVWRSPWEGDQPSALGRPLEPVLLVLWGCWVWPFRVPGPPGWLCTQKKEHTSCSFGLNLSSHARMDCKATELRPAGTPGSQGDMGTLEASLPANSWGPQPRTDPSSSPDAWPSWVGSATAESPRGPVKSQSPRGQAWAKAGSWEATVSEGWGTHGSLWPHWEAVKLGGPGEDSRSGQLEGPGWPLFQYLSISGQKWRCLPCLSTTDGPWVLKPWWASAFSSWGQSCGK